MKLASALLSLVMLACLAVTSRTTDTPTTSDTTTTGGEGTSDKTPQKLTPEEQRRRQEEAEKKKKEEEEKDRKTLTDPKAPEAAQDDLDKRHPDLKKARELAENGDYSKLREVLGKEFGMKGPAIDAYIKDTYTGGVDPTLKDPAGKPLSSSAAPPKGPVRDPARHAMGKGAPSGPKTSPRIGVTPQVSAHTGPVPAPGASRPGPRGPTKEGTVDPAVKTLMEKHPHLSAAEIKGITAKGLSQEQQGQALADRDKVYKELLRQYPNLTPEQIRAEVPASEIDKLAVAMGKGIPIPGQKGYDPAQWWGRNEEHPYGAYDPKWANGLQNTSINAPLSMKDVSNALQGTLTKNGFSEAEAEKITQAAMQGDVKAMEAPLADHLQRKYGITRADAETAAQSIIANGKDIVDAASSFVPGVDLVSAARGVTLTNQKLEGFNKVMTYIGAAATIAPPVVAGTKAALKSLKVVNELSRLNKVAKGGEAYSTLAKLVRSGAKAEDVLNAMRTAEKWAESGAISSKQLGGFMEALRGEHGAGIARTMDLLSKGKFSELTTAELKLFGKETKLGAWHHTSQEAVDSILQTELRTGKGGTVWAADHPLTQLNKSLVGLSRDTSNAIYFPPDIAAKVGFHPKGVNGPMSGWKNVTGQMVTENSVKILETQRVGDVLVVTKATAGTPTVVGQLQKVWGLGDFYGSQAVGWAGYAMYDWIKSRFGY